MSDQASGTGKNLTLLAAVVVAIWGILGLRDQPNVPYAGYSTDGNNTVTKIYPSSPAERAGLQVGDYITSIGGISVEDAKAIALRPRAEIGEVRVIVVERRADTQLAAAEAGPVVENIEVAYTQLSTRANSLGYASLLIGYFFLVFGVLPYMRRASRGALYLALVGVCLGLAFFAGPYFQSYALRATVNSLSIVLILFGFAFLLAFMLEFPKPKPILAKTGLARAIIYGPAAFLSLFIVYLIAAQPDATSGLNMLVNVLFGLFIVYYFGYAVVAMVNSYVKATPAERDANGLNLMLAGVLVGLLPVTIASLIGIFAPAAVLPGSDFYFLTLALIPISLYMAVMRVSSAPAAPTAEAV